MIPLLTFPSAIVSMVASFGAAMESAGGSIETTGKPIQNLAVNSNSQVKEIHFRSKTPLLILVTFIEQAAPSLGKAASLTKERAKELAAEISHSIPATPINKMGENLYGLNFHEEQSRATHQALG